ncbi:hypothetical protein ACWD0Z_06245 [Streptomyces sp. NPDC003007]
MTLWQPGMRITDGRLNDGIDPTIVTTGLVPASDFTVNDFYASKSGRSVMVHCYLQYTGAGLTVSPDPGGNLPDTTMCTLPDGWRPPTTINACFGDGVQDGECTVSSSGVVSLRSVFSSIENGRNVRVTANWNATS